MFLFLEITIMLHNFNSTIVKAFFTILLVILMSKTDAQTDPMVESDTITAAAGMSENGDSSTGDNIPSDNGNPVTSGMGENNDSSTAADIPSDDGNPVATGTAGNDDTTAINPASNNSNTAPASFNETTTTGNIITRPGLGPLMSALLTTTASNRGFVLQPISLFSLLIISLCFIL